VSPTTHAPPAAQERAAFFTPRATVLAVFEFSLDPPQAASAIAATVNSANFLDRVLIEPTSRIYNNSRREVLHPSLPQTITTLLAENTPTHSNLNVCATFNFGYDKENLQAEHQHAGTMSALTDTTLLRNTAPQDLTSNSV
jgi:hypothetical protein